MKRLVCLLLSACADQPAGVDIVDAGRSSAMQRPPTSPAELLPWLEAGQYRAWDCEAEPHAARPPGAHGSTRICANALLAGAGPSGAFPVGAAAVKELVGGDTLYGWAVSVKTGESGAAGEGWYWYEVVEGDVYAEGFGIAACSGCHADADASFAATARDLVFTQVATDAR
jgi:hypothetical protein